MREDERELTSNPRRGPESGVHLRGPSADAGAELPLEVYARICAECAEGTQPVTAVLERWGFTQTQWQQANERWLALILQDAQAKGADCDLALAYADAFGKAQDDLAKCTELTPEEWALMNLQVQKVGLAPVLAARGLSDADYLRLVRYWATRLARDFDAQRRYLGVVGGEVPPSLTGDKTLLLRHRSTHL